MCSWQSTVLCSVFVSFSVLMPLGILLELASFNQIVSKATHTVVHIKTLFILEVRHYCSVYVNHILLAKSSLCGHLGCFHSLALLCTYVNVALHPSREQQDI